MNRIDQRFLSLRQHGRTGLIPFVTAGDPDPAWTVPILHALVTAGADLIELGVPFSDPMADGPVIQRASERALARGVRLAGVLDMVRALRVDDQDTPLVLMGYLNPVEFFGIERFAQAAVAAGVDGVLLVDCPPEEADHVRSVFDSCGLAQIFLASPTTTAGRIAQIAELAQGYVYYVSFAGITGADHLVLDQVHREIAGLRASIETPLAVGFGVKTAAQAVALAQDADAVVIGSALVEKLAEASDQAQALAAATAFLAPIRAALDNAAVALPRTMAGNGGA
ncbi:MAG: tryptophan synthase subunit alpha [Lysobacterales bacterium]